MNYAVIGLGLWIALFGLNNLASSRKLEPQIIEVPTTSQYVIEMDESCFQQLQASEKVHIIIHNDLPH
jgi:predicted metallopeptidase